jgi:small subunit ribosomal protein S1
MSVGGTYSGTVTRLERFGAFVELRPGVEGLVHISEISTGKRITHPKEVLNVGDGVQVQLVGMDPRKRQLELSIKATQADPWSAAASQLASGMAVQGTVEAIEKFGVFIELAGGLRGLLPLSQLGEGDEKQLHSRFRPGNQVEVRVLEVDAGRRRLTLTRREDAEGQNHAALAEYRAAQSRTEGLGTLADLLAKRKR